MRPWRPRAPAPLQPEREPGYTPWFVQPIARILPARNDRTVTIQRTTFFPAAGDGPGSTLTRLRLGDELFRPCDEPRHESRAGFITIPRGDFAPWPRPRGPARPAARGIA